MAPFTVPERPLRVNTKRCPFEFLATPTASPMVWPGTTRRKTSSVIFNLGAVFSSSACLAIAACCSGLGVGAAGAAAGGLGAAEPSCADAAGWPDWPHAAIASDESNTVVN